MLRLIEDGKPENCYKYKLFTQEKQFLMAYTRTGRDLADPWYAGEYEKAFQDILEGCKGMMRMGKRISEKNDIYSITLKDLF